ncbi:uncharacterized protein BXZ73DRAFT_106683 [Epithele typhae]|uniref:uncharacterized protein n=1 Tax=Epithele typhae TaxID=378194 RepID=UPI0020089470|nr:uncharacterized protein BXZ73DRAFT_106683 [Epithele typhae]KAH9914189.1 hypothetical protein BXZ73DRAFT_106683 [Epithele typhae]
MGVSHSPPSSSPTLHLPLVTTIKPPLHPQRAQGIPMDALGSAIPIPAPRFKTTAPVALRMPAHPDRVQDTAGRVPRPSSAVARVPRSKRVVVRPSAPARCPPSSSSSPPSAFSVPRSDILPDHLNTPRASQWTPWALRFTSWRRGIRPRRSSSAVRLQAPTAYKMQRGVSLVPPRPSPMSRAQNGLPYGRPRALPALLLLLLTTLNFPIQPSDHLHDYLNAPRKSQWTSSAPQFVSRHHGSRPRHRSSSQ